MRQIFRRITRLISVETRIVLFSAAAPNNLLSFPALVIFGVLALPHLDFYSFLFNVYFEYICDW